MRSLFWFLKQINLRDQAIDAKEQQLTLLNTQNEDLSENITRVESEVEKMQKDLLEKDAELTRRRKKITFLNNNIDRLERELQKKGKYSEGAAREWSTVVIVIVIFISWVLF